MAHKLLAGTAVLVLARAGGSALAAGVVSTRCSSTRRPTSSPCTRYTAEATTGIKDWFGQHLPRPLTWSFETDCPVN